MLAPISNSKDRYSVNPFQTLGRDSPKLNQTFDLTQIQPIDDLHLPQIKGSNIDQIFLTKENNLFALRDLNNNLNKENDELKKLNHKLVDRVEYLQNFIDQEASAQEYYFNYPPKPDQELMKQAKSIPANKFDKEIDAEIIRVKQQMEEQFDREKRMLGKEMNDIKKSFSIEVDQLYGIVSELSQELISVKKQYDLSEMRFKHYYLETDRYIKSTEGNKQQLVEQVERFKSQYEIFKNKYEHAYSEIQRLNQAKTENELIINTLTQDNVRFKKKIDYYEEKYKFIDIGKMHEQLQFMTSKLEVSEGRRTNIEKELYDLRDKILRATQKSFGIRSPNKTDSLVINDQTEMTEEQKEQVKWKATREIEETSKAFLLYLQSEIQRSIDRGSAMGDWANRTTSLIDTENDSYRD